VLQKEEKAPGHGLGSGVAASNEEIQDHIRQKGLAARQPLIVALHEETHEAVASSGVQALTQVPHDLGAVLPKNFEVPLTLTLKSKTKKAKQAPAGENKASEDNSLSLIERAQKRRLRILQGAN